MVQPPGEPGAINSLAGQLRRMVGPARDTAAVASRVSSSAHEVGQNSLSDFLKDHLSEVSKSLTHAAEEFEKSSQALTSLATEISRLQSQGYALGKPLPPQDPRAAVQAQQLAGLLKQAKTSRHRASRALETSAGHTVLTKGYHYKHWYQYPWDFLVGAGTGAVDLVVGVVTIVFHPIDFLKGMKALGEGLMNDPGATGGAIWDSVINKEMLDENPAKWLGHVVFDIASLFVGGLGAVKVAGKTGKVGEAGVAAEDVSKASKVGGAADEIAGAGKKSGDLARITSDMLDSVKVNEFTKLPESTIIDHNGMLYTTDAKGRVVGVEGNLDKIVKSSRLDQTIGKFVRSHGIAGDDAGHIIAKSLGGDDKIFNLTPQNLHINRYDDWRDVERGWPGWIGKAPGNTVDVKIDLQYLGDTSRPAAYQVEWQLSDGSWDTAFIINSPSGTASQLPSMTIPGGASLPAVSSGGTLDLGP